jgi:hypothetical protein
MPRRVETICVVSGFAALGIAYTYPLILGLGSHLPSDVGDPLLTTWTLAWDADRLRHGLRGIWDAPNFFPYRHTLLYSDHLMGIAVFTAPIQWLSGNPVFVYNVAFLSSFVLAGGGMYVLAREVSGGSRVAAVVAGLAYACHPFRMAHLAHLQWLMTGWLPLALWALHRYVRSRALGHLLAATVFALLQSFTTAYFTYFALIPIVAVAVGEGGRAQQWRLGTAWHIAAAGLLATAMTLPVARAYYQVRAESGLRRTVSEIALQSAEPRDYVTAPERLRVWGRLGGGTGEHELFPGATTLAIAAVGVLSGRRQRSTRVYASIAVIACVLSFGPRGPYGWLLRVIPGLDGLRAPARLGVVVQLALSVLAGLGAVRLVERAAARRTVITSGLALAIAVEGLAAPIPTPAFDAAGPPGDRALYDALRRLPAGAVMELPTSAADVDAEFIYQYMTLIHQHPVVNGHSGYVTPLLLFLGGGHSPLRDLAHPDDVLAMLRGIGVRYVVVRRAAFTDASIPDALLAAIDRDRRDVLDTRRFVDTTLAILLPADPLPSPGPATAVPASALRAHASHGADRLAYLFDEDPDSRWLSGHQQSGNEWIELELDHARDIRLVRMRLASRSFGDYPRELAIDINDGGTVKTVFRGSVLTQFARGLVADGTFPWIDIVLPANRARSIRLQQIGRARTFFWSIHELQLREHGS